MSDVTRAQLVRTLQIDWGTYVERFHRFSPEAQKAFLARQGYERLADLLAHVVAWWTEGKRAVEQMLVEPDFQPPSVDVDAFNARAVERVRELEEPVVVESFEQTRASLLDLIRSLPDNAYANKLITDRLYIEVIGHLEEHAIP